LRGLSWRVAEPFRVGDGRSHFSSLYPFGLMALAIPEKSGATL
jgi:hypothetical protein